MSQTFALKVGMSRKHSVGALNEALGKSKVLSFRRRPRKSNNLCRAWTNSIQDMFRSRPLNLNIDDQGQVLSQKTSNASLPPSEQQQQQQELPPEFKNYIKELGATGDPVLVIQKTLFASDLDDELYRLSIPVKQVVNHGFLTEEERRRFNNKNKQAAIDAVLIGPSLAQSPIKLKKWYMGTTEVYVLVGGWNKVVERNGLKQGQTVQLWSFKKGLQLYFVLI